MKRGVFIAVFFLLVLSFFYVPVKSIPQGSCYEGVYSGLFSESELGREIPAGMMYESSSNNWRLKVGEAVNLLNYKIESGAVVQNEIVGVLHSSSTADCRYYTFEVKRHSGVIPVETYLDREDEVDGRKVCYYKLSDDMINRIDSLGGNEAGDLSQICPELLNGRVAAGESCETSAICNVNVQEGALETFGVRYDSGDSCGNVLVYADNYGNAITSSEADSRAREFIEECSNSGKEGQSSLGISATPSEVSVGPRTGGGNEGGMVSSCVPSCDGFWGRVGEQAVSNYDVDCKDVTPITQVYTACGPDREELNGDIVVTCTNKQTRERRTLIANRNQLYNSCTYEEEVDWRWVGKRETDAGWEDFFDVCFDLKINKVNKEPSRQCPSGCHPTSSQQETSYSRQDGSECCEIKVSRTCW